MEQTKVSTIGPRGRKVKILATVGPASRSPEMLRKLFMAGADAFRVNMSHGDQAAHAETIAAIRALEAEVGRPIAILCDLQGPKLRVGTFKDGKAVIRHSGHFTLDRNPEPGDETRVELPHPELFGILEKGQRLLINDGKIRPMSKCLSLPSQKRTAAICPSLWIMGRTGSGYLSFSAPKIWPKRAS